MRTDWCNSLGPPRQMFLTKPGEFLYHAHEPLLMFAIHAFLAVPLGLHHPKVAQGAPERRSAMGHGCVMGTVMMMGTVMTTKRGFKDCPGFLNSTGRLGPKRGRKCYITPAFSGVPNKGNKIGSQNLRRGSP